MTRLYSECELPTRFGTFRVRVYENDDGHESIMVSMGDLTGPEPPFVRVHSECFTGEVLRSLKCDCSEQLEIAMCAIAERGRGAIIYLRQEGRGIGLGNKVRAYAEQQKGADTIQANHILGFPTDLRDFAAAAAIMKANGVNRIELNTNNPAKVASLSEHGIVIARVAPSSTRPTPHNVEYLRTKFNALGHVGLGRALRTIDEPRQSPS